MGMLAWFVNIFVSNNALTPDAILILFITSVLALAWAIFTLFSYHRSSTNAHFVALIDIAIFGTLIAAVYQLSRIANADCSSTAPGSSWSSRLSIPDFGWPENKPCVMLKACWAFAIMNVVFFFTTAIAAFSHGDHLSAYDDRRHHRSRRNHHHHRHSSRHDHRHRSHSGGSRHSHRSPHAHRRVYV